MKKLLFFSVACLFASLSFGQSSVIFDGEDGLNPWWNLGGINVEVVDWLAKDDVNGSDYGATIWRVDDNDPWAGGGIDLDLNISNYNKLSIDINKRIAGEIQVELQDGEARAYLKADYTPDGKWQTFTFDLPEDWTHLSTLLVAPHLVNTQENAMPILDNEDHRMSWDNVVVFHDPSTESATIIMPEDRIIIQSVVYDINGVRIGEFGRDEDSFLNQLSQGIYLIRMIDTAGLTAVSKIIITQ